jgi:hypothetical protein
MQMARTHSDLTSMVVSNPAPAMIPTAVGSGGQAPTQVLPGANSSTGIAGSGKVPTTPTLFLKPTTFSTYGIPTVREAAYSKVWWNGTTQTKAVVSLQQRDSSGSASTGLARLVALNSNTANLTNTDFRITSTSAFPVSGVPGATGLVWDVTVGQGSESLPIEFRFAVFHRRSVVALVSMTSYSRATDAGAFLTFAQSQYAQMSAAPSSNFLQLLDWIGVAGVGLVLIAVIIKLANRKQRPTAPVSAQYQWVPFEPIQEASWPPRPPRSAPFPPDGEQGNAHTG